jgi:hypothetical protein
MARAPNPYKLLIFKRRKLWFCRTRMLSCFFVVAIMISFIASSTCSSAEWNKPCQCCICRRRRRWRTRYNFSLTSLSSLTNLIARLTVQNFSHEFTTYKFIVCPLFSFLLIISHTSFQVAVISEHQNEDYEALICPTDVSRYNTRTNEWRLEERQKEDR